MYMFLFKYASIYSLNINGYSSRSIGAQGVCIYNCVQENESKCAYVCRGRWDEVHLMVMVRCQ